MLDRYKGAPVETGHCSLNVRLRFRSEDTTLRDEQVEPLMKTVREMLLKIQRTATRLSSAKASQWVVWGKKSNGCTDNNSNIPSAHKRDRSLAKVDGLQLT